mgnify:CR=1 FL=1
MGFATQYKDSLPPLDLHLINIIRGGLLGDFTGIRRSNAPTDSLKIELPEPLGLGGGPPQKFDRFEYVDHLYYVFYDFVGSRGAELRVAPPSLFT